MEEAAAVVAAGGASSSACSEAKPSKIKSSLTAAVSNFLECLLNDLRLLQEPPALQG